MDEILADAAFAGLPLSLWFLLIGPFVNTKKGPGQSVGSHSFSPRFFDVNFPMAATDCASRPKNMRGLRLPLT